MMQVPATLEPGAGALLGGRYRLVRVLGRGGMGSVWEATQEDLRRKVAVKLLDPKLASDPAQVERFRREALAAAELGHPNIVSVTDFQWRAGEPPFLVMELLAGESLGARIERTGPLPVTMVSFVASQLLDALGAAHAGGIVHRDVKPDNVFLTSLSGVSDVVKVLDFGVAKLGDDGGAKLTQSGAMVGTPAYMSPEQTRGESIDARADLYAVGAAMYHALTGRLPFEAPTMPAMFVAIATRPPEPLHVRRPDVPAELAAVVDRAMAKDPSQRFQTAQEFRAALAPWVASAYTPSPAASASAEFVDVAASTLAGSPPQITPVHGPPNTPVVVVRTPAAPMSDPPVMNAPAARATPAAPSKSGAMSGCATMVVALVVGAVVIAVVAAVAIVLVARSKAATDSARILRDAVERSDAAVRFDGDGLRITVTPDAPRGHDLDAGSAPTAADAGVPHAQHDSVSPPRGPHASDGMRAASIDASVASSAGGAAVSPTADVRDEAPLPSGGKFYSGQRVRVTLSDTSGCPACSTETIKRTLENAQASFDGCARRYAHAPPEHQLQVMVANIGSDGRYESVVPAATPTLPGYDACLASVIRGIPPSGARSGTFGQSFKVTLYAECPTFNCK